MAHDSEDEFRVRLGRARSRAGRDGSSVPPFMKEVEAAVRKAGGDPTRIGVPAGKGSGWFDARRRGAKLFLPQG
jgi:hypothetical protein